MAKRKGPDRVKAALEALALDCEVLTLPGSTRTAAEAAAALGCTVGEIAKSLVFRAGDRAVVAVLGGGDRLDTAGLSAAAGAGGQPGGRRVRPGRDRVRNRRRAPARPCRARRGVHGPGAVPVCAGLGGGGQPVLRVRHRAGTPARRRRSSGPAGAASRRRYARARPGRLPGRVPVRGFGMCAEVIRAPGRWAPGNGPVRSDGLGMACDRAVFRIWPRVYESAT